MTPYEAVLPLGNLPVTVRKGSVLAQIDYLVATDSQVIWFSGSATYAGEPVDINFPVIWPFLDDDFDIKSEIAAVVRSVRQCQL